MTTDQVVSCPACGAKNRVRVERVDRGMMPRCGRCRAPLSMDWAPVDVTDATFAQVVERSSLPVLVDFWAPWCGPCRMITPALEQIAGEMAGRVRVAKLLVDENPATANRFAVSSIPMLVMFKNGRAVDQIVGAPQPRGLVQWVARHVG